jgi:hypothetical protein
MTRRRILLAVTAVVLIAGGIGLARGLEGAVAAFAGDALYAALLYVVVAVIAPRLRAVVAAPIAFAVCAAVECLQLTGVPAALAQTVPGAALVLGTTFQWTDLLAYAIGAAAAGVVDALSRRAAGSSRGGRRTPSADAPLPHPRGGTPSR